MGYEEENDRSGRRRSRARQPVKRMGDREVNRRRNGEPGHERPGLNLITDSFSDRGRRSAPEEYYGSGWSADDGFTESPAPSRAQRRSKKRSEKKSREAMSRRAARETAASRPRASQSDIYTDPAKRWAKKRKGRIRIIILEVFILIGILLFAGYSYVNSRLDMMQRLPWDPDEIKNVDISEEKQEQMKGYWTIAIFGVDSRNSSVGKGNNSDVNIICNINQDTGEIKLVSVYRDTYLNISDKNSYNKINAAYLQGGPEQAVKAMNKNLDLDIDDYATFNWKAVADAINILGGIDVEITKAEFYYINAFISETVKATGIGSTQLKSAGMNHLDGVQAVAYGRLRLMDTDYARTERQRKVISLAFEKAKQADWATLNCVVQTVFPQVATSVDLGDLLTMGRGITKYHLTETTGFPADRSEANMGSKGACVIPNTLEENVIELHRFLFGDENYVPTDTVQTISSKILSDVGQAKATKAATKSTGKTEEASVESRGPEESGENGRPGESGETGENLRPGESGESSRDPSRATEYETDSLGNVILPSGGNGRDDETNPSESGQAPMRPGETRPSESRPGYGSSQAAPGETRESAPARPGTYPGSTQEQTQENTVIRPGTTPGSGENGNTGPWTTAPSGGAPGSSSGNNSGTGVIIRPGETVSDAGNSSPKVDFSGPMGN